MKPSMYMQDHAAQYRAAAVCSNQLCHLDDRQCATCQM